MSLLSIHDRDGRTEIVLEMVHSFTDVRYDMSEGIYYFYINGIMYEFNDRDTAQDELNLLGFQLDKLYET